MSIIDRILLFILSLLLGIFSIIMMIFPFNQFVFLSMDNIHYFLESIKGNYLYSGIGIILFLLSIRALLSSIKLNNKEKAKSYLVKMTEYGEIKISSDTIVGLVQYVSKKFTEIRNIKAKVDVVEGQLFILLKGEVSPEINIPETTANLQIKVKEHIENCTGVNVTEIKVIINNITTPIRDIK